MDEDFGVGVEFLYVNVIVEQSVICEWVCWIDCQDVDGLIGGVVEVGKVIDECVFVCVGRVCEIYDVCCVLVVVDFMNEFVF